MSNIYFQKQSTMSTSGKVIAISIGVFGGGGFGFYLRETYYFRVKQEKCAKLEEELKELVHVRKAKEDALNSRTSRS